MYSYDITNSDGRNQALFATAIADRPTFTGRLMSQGSKITSHGTAHKWFDRQLSETTTTITSFDTDGDGTGINVGSTSHIKAYDLLTFTSSTGQRRTEVCQVASVDSATDLTLTRDYGSSPGETLVVGDIVYSQRQNPEGLSATGYESQTPTEGTESTNYTQIFDYLYKASLSNLNTIRKDFASREEWLDDVRMQGILSAERQMAQALFNGYKKAHTNITTAVGAAGGLNQFLAGGNVNSTGGAITLDHIDDVLEDIYDDTTSPGNYQLIMSPNQSRNISQLPTSNTNPIVNRERSDRVQGGYTSIVESTLGGFTGEIFIDPKCPKDTIYVVNSELIALAFEEDGMLAEYGIRSAEGDDYDGLLIRGKATFEIVNGTTAHGIITGLDV